MNSEDFKQNLVNQIKNLRPERKDLIINAMIEAFKEALEEVGVKLDIKIRDNEEFPKHMEEFIDMLKSMPNAQVIKIGEDGSMENVSKMHKASRDYDTAIKNLGDTVKVTNVGGEAYMHDFVTKKQLSKDFELPKDIFTDKLAIVIEIDTEFKFNCGHCDDIHNSDLVIFFPDLKKSYHIHSKFVKII